MHAKRKLKDSEKASLKRALNGLEYICGSSFQEFVVDESKDSKILLTVYVKENQSCTCPVEKPYYSCDFLKPVCYYCGKGKNLVISERYFPKCTSAKCKAEKNVNKPKIKTLTQADLTSNPKKKK